MLNKHTDIIHVSEESNVKFYITIGHLIAERSVQHADDPVRFR